MNKRQLDAWIAENAFQIEVEYDANGEPYNKQGVISGYIISYISHYTEDSGAFALVKREIERRGWNWNATYDISDVPPFWFCISEPDKALAILGATWAETEELAGCLALKEALER